MKFQFVKEVEGEVPSYDGKRVRTGDVVELEGHLASKARMNLDYRQLDEEPKRRGRPPKVRDGD